MAKEEEKKEEKLTIVGDGADAPEETTEEAAPEKETKETQASADEDDEGTAEEGSDERVGHAEDEGEDREAIRERRRQERKNRREKDARLRREVDFLRTRNEALEREQSRLAQRQDAHENLTIDQKINQIDGQIKEATRIHTRAMMAKDEETAVEAASVKDQLAEEKSRLEGLRESRKETATTTKTPANGGIDPEIFQNASSWVERNKEWFDPKLGDERSVVTRFMEGKIFQETGLRPNTPEYWEELDRRVAKRFPDLKKNGRAMDDDDDGEDFDKELDKGKPPVPKRKSSGPRFSVGGKTRALKPGEVFISAARRQAMEEAGVWDDEETRQRYLNSYKKYDEEEAKNSRTR